MKFFSDEEIGLVYFCSVAVLASFCYGIAKIGFYELHKAPKPYTFSELVSE